MDCKKCNVELLAYTSIQVCFPSSFNHHLTKKVFTMKQSRILSQDHYETRFICPVCGDLTPSVNDRVRSKVKVVTHD